MKKVVTQLFMLFMIALLVVPGTAMAQGAAPASADPLAGLSVAGGENGSAAQATLLEPTATFTVTLLHTNDFHGQLEPSGSNPGLARLAYVISDTVTSPMTLMLDAGDEMQGSLLSNLQKGKPTIAAFNQLGTDVATFGNHEFDWGQTNLISRTQEAAYPFVSANITVKDGADCASSGWAQPSFVDAPYTIKTLTDGTNTVKVGIIGVTTIEVPVITIAAATAGLCFKDPLASITHYYDQMKTDGATVIIVLSHLGFNDGGYGYGVSTYGDKSLAQKLIDANKPADVIVGGHSHTNMASTGATVVQDTTKGFKTTIMQAYYNGRQVGRAQVGIDGTTGKATNVTWKTQAVPTSGPKDPAMNTLIGTYTSDPAYVALISKVIGYTGIPLIRYPNGSPMIEGLMQDLVDDSIYNYLNTDADPANDIDLFLNNAGGIRADITTTLGYPYTLTYGAMFTVLPFGNQTVVGKMTGAQINDVLNQAATLAASGALQPAGLKYKVYRYAKTLPGATSPSTWAWGAFDIQVKNKTTSAWESLVMTQTYQVGTNEFLAPAGGDNYAGFKYMTNVKYYGDMLDQVNAYISMTYGTPATAYQGPLGDGKLDGRVTREGTDAGGSIVPLTILHHNDSHGRLLPSGSYQGYDQLATLIKQERAYNPDHTLLLSSGDNIQGDSMMYYYRTAPQGFDADGNTLPITLTTHPLIAAFNAMNYDAYVLGNHEFNFGNTVFKSVLKQATFPVLQANLTDSGEYGLAEANVKGSVVKTLGSEGIKVAILGIGNHRIPNYELPSNIKGLAFTNPIDTAAAQVPALRSSNDVVIALTHIGFTDNPKSVEVDSNVDTYLAKQVGGIDAIIGGHSHTNPAAGESAYKYLPAYVSGPNNTAVLVNQAYRYNTYLGEVVLGLREKSGGGYEVVTRAARDIAVNPLTSSTATPEDATIKALLQPYQSYFNTYNTKVVGQTTAPIDALQAFTQETNGANLQADASVWALAQHGVNVDFHLSGAMTNSKIAAAATPAAPVTLKVSDMFSAMPYENSLVTMKMTGPQLKTVLERAYRNYFYYKYYANADPKYGGYSYYTTCMLDVNSVGQITYKDTYPTLPDGNNVLSLVINGKPLDFTDPTKEYLVSTVNYLAAGSCNFNDGGVSLWPLDKVVNDTQYYVRDVVIDYLRDKGIVTPSIEGRILPIPAASLVPVSPLGAMLVYTGTNNLNVTIAIPKGAFDGNVEVAYTKLPEPYNGGLNTAGVAFDLSVFVNGVPVTTLERPITVYVEYTDADVAGMLESSLTLNYWNGSQWADAACGAYDRHPDQNYFAVPICHLSRFAALGLFPRYLPVVNK